MTDCGYLVQKLNDCAHRYLREYDYAGPELIYCDPSYLLEKGEKLARSERATWERRASCCKQRRIL